MNKKEFIEDDIILCDREFFNGDDEHCYNGKFYDGYAVLNAEPDDCGVPEKIILTYPKMEEVRKDKNAMQQIVEWSGLDSEKDVTFYSVALKFGTPKRFEILLADLLDAIDYSFLRTDGTYDKSLTYPVIDEVNYIKKLIKQ